MYAATFIWKRKNRRGTLTRLLKHLISFALFFCDFSSNSETSTENARHSRCGWTTRTKPLNCEAAGLWPGSEREGDEEQKGFGEGSD